MLILKYFLVVGAVLTAGLIALNAHLLPAGSTAPATSIHAATSASLPTVTPKAQPAKPELDLASVPTQLPPAKGAASGGRSHHSARAHRRAH
ncbi:MAG: hypothetical protein E6G76_08900 [Alphaproteobacteria bacterium]|jgi:hypothetical protein|nr:MAG: hypothetical protein E6G76_08900 [Alphaproteobacteria bacterium]